MIIDPAEQSLKENHKIMIGSIVPRPIAFVSTKSNDGILNLAPFSYFNGVCSNPPTIMFAPARRGYDGLTKDTLNNIQDTKEFVVNLVSEEISEPMVACATDYDKEVDEFEISGLTPIDCVKVKPPRVKESKVSFECSLNTVVEIGRAEAGAGFIVEAVNNVVIHCAGGGTLPGSTLSVDTVYPIGVNKVAIGATGVVYVLHK